MDEACMGFINHDFSFLSPFFFPPSFLSFPTFVSISLPVLLLDWSLHALLSFSGYIEYSSSILPPALFIVSKPFVAHCLHHVLNSLDLPSPYLTNRLSCLLFSFSSVPVISRLFILLFFLFLRLSVSLLSMCDLHNAAPLRTTSIKYAVNYKIIQESFSCPSLVDAYCFYRTTTWLQWLSFCPTFHSGDEVTERRKAATSWL
ncbi:hypothetical protein F5880DRAFT_32286 [Lentinula raphanica]|nr:hypothetical protein F5880DRAFT_32286 [Lentinula raphanica]